MKRPNVLRVVSTSCAKRARTPPGWMPEVLFGDRGGLADAGVFTAFLGPLRKTEWVVYAKKPLGATLPFADLNGSTGKT